jgi:hypothetical protein
MGPGDAYESMVSGLWPQLGDERQYHADKAWHQVDDEVTLNFETGEWEAIPQDGTRPLLRITCEPRSHFQGGAPMLAELWKTSYGRLFVSSLPGAAFDQGDDLNDPFAPPTAVLPKRDRN